MTRATQKAAPTHSGSKYFKPIAGDIFGFVDVYAFIETFDVRCAARQHALKKILFAGKRSKGSSIQDLQEAQDALTRAIQLEQQRLERAGKDA